MKSVVLSCLIAATAAANPREELRAARRNFIQGQYFDSIKILRALLEPTPRLGTDDDIIAARELLAVCHHIAGDGAAARREFERILLEVRPSYELDPLLYPPPVIAFFERLRADLGPRRREAELRLADAQQERDAAEKRRLEEEARSKPKARASIKERIVQRNKLVNLIPFGAGQFQNGHTSKGVALLVVEVLALGANIGAYVAIEGQRGADGRFTGLGALSAKRLQAVQISSLAVFAAFFVYGMLDGLSGFKAETVTIERLPDAATMPRAKGVSLVPWLSQERGGAAAGIGVGVAF